MKKMLWIVNPHAGRGALSGKVIGCVNVFQQAGYDVTYDADTQTPGIAAPQTRIFAPENDEVQATADRVQTACGLEDRTMDYLIRYEYGDDLLRKLAAAIG